MSKSQQEEVEGSGADGEFQDPSPPEVAQLRYSSRAVEEEGEQDGGIPWFTEVEGDDPVKNSEGSSKWWSYKKK